MDATYKAFSGTVELAPHVSSMRNVEFAAKFPGVKGLRNDSFSMKIGWLPNSKTPMPVTRIIRFKANPSLHKCDARCRTAKGGNCECSCGGQFHGADCH